MNHPVAVQGENPCRSPSKASLFRFSPLAFELQAQFPKRRPLPLTAFPAVIETWRKAVLCFADQLPLRARELLSGHHADGSPLQEPHVALVPLADVARSNASGCLTGLALALPQALEPDTEQFITDVASRLARLHLGRLGVVRLEPLPLPWVSAAFPLVGLGGATHWATVTPVVFDRHPKAKANRELLGELAQILGNGCAAVGLPRPREVVVTQASVHLGVPPAHHFPRLRRKDGSERCHAHAIVVFDEPVCGPVLLGAGRYRGYGVCAALDLGAGK